MDSRVGLTSAKNLAFTGIRSPARTAHSAVAIPTELSWPTAAYSGADKSLARPTSRCILFDGENISFDASLVIYINK